MEEVGNQGGEESGGELEQWIRYKRERAVRFVQADYSVEWLPDRDHWLQVFAPGCPVEKIPEYRAWAKFYIEPFEYGIDNGRISKLYIQEINYGLEKLIGDKRAKALWTLYSYDRCLEVDILDESPPARELYKTVIRVLN